MTKRCLDEGTLQAYLDGELSGDAARDAAVHVADCAACAGALAEIGNDNVFFASAFAPDSNLSVPTAELRARLNTAIAQLDASPSGNGSASEGRNLKSLFAFLPGLFSLTPQRAAAFASIAVAILLAAVFVFRDRQNQSSGDMASINKSGKPNPVPTASPTPTPGEVLVRPSPEATAQPTANKKRTPAGKRNAPFTPVPAPRIPQNFFVPGEREYQSTIANLDRTIKTGDSVLKPSVVADYERSIAVLDKAIEETRKVALQNPKDRDAVNFLRSAYQSKIELMTTVADSAQVATLDR